MGVVVFIFYNRFADGNLSDVTRAEMFKDEVMFYSRYSLTAGIETHRYLE